MTLEECNILRRKLLSVPIKEKDRRQVDFGYSITGRYRVSDTELLVSLSNLCKVKVPCVNAVPDYVRLDGAVYMFLTGFMGVLIWGSKFLLEPHILLYYFMKHT